MYIVKTENGYGLVEGQYPVNGNGEPLGLDGPVTIAETEEAGRGAFGDLWERVNADGQFFANQRNERIRRAQANKAALEVAAAERAQTDALVAAIKKRNEKPVRSVKNEDAAIG